MPGTPETVLILGGTAEATDLAQRLVDAGDRRVITSMAGRTRSPDLPAGETRIGGFGGVDGLAEFIGKEAIDLIVDATHPFAPVISDNAAAAAARTGTSLLRLTRPAWTPQAGDNWQTVPSLEAANAAIPRAATVFLALGRQYLDTFADRTDVSFILRMVDRPEKPPPFADFELLTGKPSPDRTQEAELLKSRGVTHIVCRNSGGSGSYAKIAAARQLSIPVIMIARPPASPGRSFASVDDLMAAIA